MFSFTILRITFDFIIFDTFDDSHFMDFILPNVLTFYLFIFIDLIAFSIFFG